jgi:hypothetical protein
MEQPAAAGRMVPYAYLIQPPPAATGSGSATAAAAAAASATPAASPSAASGLPPFPHSASTSTLPQPMPQAWSAPAPPASTPAAFTPNVNVWDSIDVSLPGADEEKSQAAAEALDLSEFSDLLDVSRCTRPGMFFPSSLLLYSSFICSLPVLLCPLVGWLQWRNGLR